MKKYFIFITLLIICSVYSAELFDKIELKVNDKFATKRMIDKYNQFLNLISQDKLSRDATIKNLANTFVLEYYLEEKSINISDKDVNRQIDELLENNKMSDINTILLQLKSKGLELTEKEFKDFIRKQIVIKKAQEYVILKDMRDKLTIPSDDELKDFYNKNKEYFKDQTTIKISHLVKTVSDNMGLKEKIAIEENLNNIAKKLRHIKNIEIRIKEFESEVQKNASEIYKKNNGDLGYFDEEKLKSIFPQYITALKMNKGDLSNVVVTQYTRAIFIVTDKKGGEILPFENVKNRIIDILLYNKGAKMFMEWLDKYSKKYEITVR